MAVKTYSKSKNGETYLSTNFQVKEFACHDGSDIIKIDTELVSLLQNIRTHFNKPLTLNSAYRTPTHNRRVGGVSNSQHVYGTAADIVVSGVNPSEVAKYAEFLMPNKGGIGLYSTFTHVDVRSNRSRWKNYGREISVNGFPGYVDPNTVVIDKNIKINEDGWSYHVEGTTQIIEVDPLLLSIWQPDCKGTDINIANFVNGGYSINQADGTTLPQGHLVSDGKIISNYATHGKPVTTLCIFYDNVVQVKKISDISLERGLKFAISGASLTDYKNEGFIGKFSDIVNSSNRTYIGYRKKDHKIVICVRDNTSLQRAEETFKNLGVDAGLTLTNGKHVCMRVKGNWKVKSTQQINNIIMWG